MIDKDYIATTSTSASDLKAFGSVDTDSNSNTAGFGTASSTIHTTAASYGFHTNTATPSQNPAFGDSKPSSIPFKKHDKKGGSNLDLDSNIHIQSDIHIHREVEEHKLISASQSTKSSRQ